MRGDTEPRMKMVWTGMGQLGEAGTMKTTKSVCTHVRRRGVTESLCSSASGGTTPQPQILCPRDLTRHKGLGRCPWFTRAQGLHRGPREGQTRGGGEAE